MPIEHTLAVVAVRDIDEATAWYERFFGRPPTNRPMPSLVEWQITDGGWLQVTGDAHRSGRSLVNVAVDDLPAFLSALVDRGLAPGEIIDANKGVQLSSLTDPDGNVITVIGGFRPAYDADG